MKTTLPLTNGNLESGIKAIDLLVSWRLDMLTAHALCEARYALAAPYAPVARTVQARAEQAFPGGFIDPKARTYPAFEAEYLELMVLAVTVDLEPVLLSRILAHAGPVAGDPTPPPVGLGHALLVLRELGIVVQDPVPEAAAVP